MRKIKELAIILVIIFFAFFLCKICFGTVSSQTVLESFNCNGSTTEFNFTFRIFQASDLDVYLLDETTGDQTTLIYNSDYSVTATNNDFTSGGTITTTETYGGNYILVAIRNTSLTQEARFVANSALEDTLDRQTLAMQEVQNWKERALRVPISDVNVCELPTAENRKGYFLAFSSTDGHPIASSGGVPSELTVSSFAETLIDDANNTEARTTLGAVGLTGNETIAGIKTFSNDVNMASGKTLTVEIIQAVDSTGVLLKNDGGTTVITIGDDGTATLADGSQLSSSAAPTTDADIPNKKYVDDQVLEFDSTNLYDPNDSDGNAMLKAHAYQAQTDGFVSVYLDSIGAGKYLRSYVDDTDDPAGSGTKIQEIVAPAAAIGCSLFFAVPNNTYFEITTDDSEDPTILWMSIGTYSAPVDQD